MLAFSWIYCGWTPWLVFWYNKGRRCLTISQWAWLCTQGICSGTWPLRHPIWCSGCQFLLLRFPGALYQWRPSHCGGRWSLAGMWHVRRSRWTCRGRHWCWIMFLGRTWCVWQGLQQSGQGKWLSHQLLLVWQYCACLVSSGVWMWVRCSPRIQGQDGNVEGSRHLWRIGCCASWGFWFGLLWLCGLWDTRRIERQRTSQALLVGQWHGRVHKVVVLPRWRWLTSGSLSGAFRQGWLSWMIWAPVVE